MSIVQVLAPLIVLLPHLFVTSCSESPKSFAEIKGVRIIEDVSYRSSNQGAEPDRHTFDLYLPQTGRGKPPLLVFVHGGFWIHSDDEYGIGRSLAEELASRGVAVALVRYRLGPKREHPGQVRDVAAAVAHLVSKVDQYGYDAKRIFLSGHSAGAHLVALVALDGRYLGAHGMTLKSLAGVIGISGIYNLSERSELTNDQKKAILNIFGNDPAVLKDAAPVTHVKPGAPPFLLISASGDLFDFNIDTRRFSDALNDKGGQMTTPVIVPGRDHLSVVKLDGPENDTRDLILNFLKVRPLPPHLKLLIEAKRARLHAFPSTVPFWKYKDLIHSFPIDKSFMLLLVGHYGLQKYELLHWSFDKFHAIDLFAYLDAMPEERIGKGDYLVLTNHRNEAQVWHKDDIKPYKPVIVIGIDDERNLFHMGGLYRMNVEYSWKEGPRPPVMFRPVGAFVYFLKPTPDNLQDQSWNFALTEDSFKLVDKNPFAAIENLPKKLYQVLTIQNGCVYCHRFPGIGSRSFHTVASNGAAHGGFAMPLEDYPPEVWKVFVFNQKAAADKVGATPNMVEESVRQSLYELVVQSRETKRPVILRQ